MNPNQQAIAVAENLTADIFHQVLDLAIQGRGKVPGAKSAARNHLEARKDPESAIRWYVNQHIAMAGSQGLLTNWGGIVTAIATVPANLAAAALIQARMVAGIAHLRGYELSDPRVRTAMLMVMLGPTAMERLMGQQSLPSPAAIATAPVFDARLDGQVSKALFDHTMSQLSTKRLGVAVAKRIPIVGGGVGLLVDGWSTRGIAQYAMEQFPSRRPKRGSITADQAPDED